ncbi:C40 family peptidase [Rhodobacter sp. KR11]|uniref:C40 family peptidase n=1 Tax=Rhodobacter sp. KR11 TaxID=2974588 RepID=UPI002221F604|nr:C40 family peptidase [Rhodobacter sp. KR11]MCW1917186.1 C40 family peptidase [Rhodobacter sp. KR11]
MTDRRLTPATSRLALATLAGQTDLPLTEGSLLRVALPLVDLLRSPGGPRDRQLWLGERFTVIDREGDHVFGQAQRDGYCGWLPESALAEGTAATHWISAPSSHLYPEPRVQAHERAALPMGARLTVTAEVGAFAETPLGFVPMVHLTPLGRWLADPVSVAESLLGSPYLWGGNSRAGIDCSGLVQLAHHACGITLPGDSDLQEAATPRAEGPFQRGDLLFWQGHVALAVGESLLIHANGHTMSVAYEPIEACLARIKAAEGRVLSSHRRP